MTAPAAILCAWTGEELRPANPLWARRADQQWVVGEQYYVEIRQERSVATHNHFFAAVAEAHSNLPEEAAERFATPDALRKYALIRTGYRDERSIVCNSKAEAQRMAAFVRPMDEFAIVVAIESTVTVWTAKSQSMKAMGKKEFAASKESVLDYIAGMIGVTPDALAANTEKVA